MRIACLPAPEGKVSDIEDGNARTDTEQKPDPNLMSLISQPAKVNGVLTSLEFVHGEKKSVCASIEPST